MPGIVASWSSTRLRVENRALDEPGLDLELLPRGVLLEGLDDLGGGAGVLVAPGDARHADEDVVELLLVRRVLEGVLDERVLDDLVLDAGLAELGPELRDVLHRHPLEVEEDGRRHLVEAGLDLADLNVFGCAFHGLCLFGLAHEVSGVDLASPGPMVELTVMLRR